MSETFDKLPPQSLDAERCLLASMMLDREMIGIAAEKIDKQAFYLTDHQILFDALIHLYQSNKNVDPVVLAEELGKRQLLSEIGGVPYLMEILQAVPSAANGKQYAEIVREKAILRELINASNQILRDAYSPHEQADTVLEQAEKRIFEIAQNKIGNPAEHIKEIVHEVVLAIEQRNRRGLETGYFDLDDMLNGLQPGEMLVLAARPSMGKTALAMNIVENIALQGVACAVFSLEMSRQSLVQRLLMSRARIPGENIRTGQLGNDQFMRINQAAADLHAAPIWIDDSSQLTILDLRAKARRLYLQNQIKMIVIDYLQLMDNPGVDSRQQQISEISRGIKSVARDLGIPVIALSQLNRAAETREGNRPRMSDLRESGSIEQDADVVMLLHREDYYHRTEPDFRPTFEAEVIIAKQRNGPTGVVKLHFEDKITRFENLTRSAGSGAVDPFGH